MRTHNNFQYANTPKEQDLYKRQIYLDKLIARKDNGLIKVITGVRRCGKSFLLFKLYKEYLNSLGIEDSRIIQISLEETENFSHRYERGKHNAVVCNFEEQIRYISDVPIFHLSVRI